MRIPLCSLLALVLSASASASGGRLEVLVTGGGGRPLSGAHVWIGEQEQRSAANWAVAEGVSGPDGRAVLASGRCIDFGLRPWFGRYRLIVSAPGYAKTVRDRVFIADGMQRLEVRLEPGRSVSGRVLTGSGKPVAGARVGLRPPGCDFRDDPARPWLPQARTGADGRFVLPHVEAGVHGLVAVAPEGVGWRKGMLVPGPEVEIRLRPGYAIKGLVDGAYRERVGGRGYLSGCDTPYGTRFQIDPDGRFCLSNVPPGTYDLGWRTVRVADRDLEIDLRASREVEPGLLVRGTVRTTDGRPVGGATVESLNAVWSRGSAARAETDSHGRFELHLHRRSQSSEAKLALLATAGTSAGWVVMPANEGPAETAIVVREPADSLRVVVQDASTGRPLAGSLVGVHPEWRARSLIVTTGIDGATERMVGFANAMLFPGGVPRPSRQHRVWVASEFSYLPWSSWTRLNGATELSVSLIPRPQLRGRVLDEKGRPRPGIRLLCWDGQADTDENGDFTMLGNRRDADFRGLRWTGLPRLDPSLFPPLGAPPGHPRPGHRGVYVIPFTRRVGIRLRVGAEREGWIVVLGDPQEPRAHYYPRTYVDGSGEASFGLVHEGAYKVWVRRTWEDEPEVLGPFVVEARPDSTVTVDLTTVPVKSGREGE